MQHFDNSILQQPDMGQETGIIEGKHISPGGATCFRWSNFRNWCSTMRLSSRGVFSAQAFIEFQRYISRLIVSENKTVGGINPLVVHRSRNQSSLNGPI